MEQAGSLPAAAADPQPAPPYMAKGEHEMQGEKIIGIDLGTTNSVVAVVEGGEPKVIQNAEGNRLTPSVVAYTEKGELVGEPAKRQAVTNARRTVSSIKRFMGRRHSEVESEEKMVPYQITGAASDYVKVAIDGREHTPQEISSKTLRKLKESAEAYLGHKVNKAVITVPAYFNDAQRQATKDAGQIAGLEVMRIINEPTAAALAYGLDKKRDQKIVVFDLGGGTFDVSVLEVAGTGEGDTTKVFQVLSTSGDTHLGGDDFDVALINYVAQQFQQEQGIDLRQDTMALQRLQEACEKAKRELSSTPQTDINLPFITADATGPKHLQLTLTRARFEELIDPYLERIRKPVQQALADAQLQPADIDEVVLVGGSTRVPKVQQLVREYFGKEPHKGVNPDEVVAVGAAIQGSVLAGERSDVLLLDVTPLSLGIETQGGVFTRLVERNTTIPVEKREIFSTAEDNQPAVTVRVFQGERPMAADNRLLGQFNLEGLVPAPRGVPQIEVTFDIDQNGILNVRARDKTTSKEASVRIEDSAGLSDSDITRMKKDAELHAAEDKRKFELADARNQANQQCFQLEKLMQEHRDKLSAADREPLQQSIEKVRQLAKEDDTDALKSALQDLEQAAQALGKVLYQRAQPCGAAADCASAAGGAGYAGAARAEDEPIDAEFEVKS